VARNRDFEVPSIRMRRYVLLSLAYRFSLTPKKK